MEMPQMVGAPQSRLTSMGFAWALDAYREKYCRLGLGSFETLKIKILS